MKTSRSVLKPLIVLFSAFAATAGFGQAVRTWDGGGDGITVGTAANWSDDILPGNGATAQWDGVVAGNLSLNYNGGIGGNFQQTGCSYSLSVNQTGSVTIKSPVSASANLAVNHFTNSSPSAAFSLGDSTANVLNVIWRADGGAPVNFFYLPHRLINDSASPVTIYPNVKFTAGGGNQHILEFNGSGNWIITNSMRADIGTTINKLGSGTLFWSGPSIGAALGAGSINSPVDIEGGTVVLLASGLLGTQRITNNGTMLQYAAPSAQTLSGPIHGAGILRVSSGTLTLSSGASDFTGSIQLTNSGTLIAGGTENPTTGPLGMGGTISFDGGTLQFSVANTFDYSPRFSMAANQAYKFDTAAQNVTFTNALTSSGGTLTKLGSGVLTLAGANTYSGLTAVGGGKLVVQGSAGSGNIIVSNSTAFGVTATGTSITPATLTVGTSSGATLEFNNVNSTAMPMIAAGSVSAGGPITVNVNSGTFIIGQSYPLFSWTSGSAPAVTLGTLTGASGSLSTNGSTITLNITSLAFVWSGLTDGNWDTTTANNWMVNGVSQIFANGSTALFDDTAAGETNVVLNAAVSPLSTTVNSSAKIYSITSSGANLIGGSGGLTKNGSSTLTLAGGVNSYSGATTIAGGTLTVSALADGGSASDIGAASSSAANLVLSGGTLQYFGGGASINRLFTLGTGNGTIDSSGGDALVFNNSGVVALSGSGPRTLTLNGSSPSDNTIAGLIGDNGGATSLAKSGSGKWVLTGNNTNSGTVTIAAGTLQVGAGGPSGAIGSGNVVDNGSLIFNTSGSVTNGTVTGTGSLTVDGGGTVVLPGDNTYSGGTTINNGTLQVGNGGVTGKLNGTSPIFNDGTLIFNTTASVTIAGFGANITGSGNLIKRGASLLQIYGNNTYSGWTEIGPGSSVLVCFGNQGQFASSVVTNNGSLIMDRQDNNTFFYSGNIVGSGSLSKIVHNGNAGDVTLTGTHTYTGGTHILGGAIILGDNGTTPLGGSIVGNVFLTNDYANNVFGTAPNDFVPATLTFNRADDFIFSGDIVGNGFVTLIGSGTVTLTGNNTYTNNGTGATTTITAGTLQVGNGGTSGTVGTGSIVNNSLLVFNRSDALTIGRTIGGSGSVVKTGAGTLTFNGTNNYFGTLTVSNGTLIVNGEDFAASVAVYGGTLGGTGVFYGPVTLEAGTTLAPGASVGTLTFNGNLDIGGNIAVEVDKSLSPSNDVVVVVGTLTKVGAGTLTVANLGPTLQVGDKFTLFSQPLVNGGAVTITGGSATWINNLATDGSITVATVTAPPTLNVNQTGNNLQFSWTASGYKLQAQTNTLNVGIGSNWGDYPGGGSSPVNAPIDTTKGAVFFRLAPTP
jgi:fibronectin-binding autotransporter adhesin